MRIVVLQKSGLFILLMFFVFSCSDESIGKWGDNIELSQKKG